MSKKNSKKKYKLEDEILVKLETVLAVKVRDLDIHPEYMSITKIKKIIADHLDFLIRESESVEPVAHSVKILKNMTRSGKVNKEKDSI